MSVAAVEQSNKLSDPGGGGGVVVVEQQPVDPNASGQDNAPVITGDEAGFGEANDTNQINENEAENDNDSDNEKLFHPFISQFLKPNQNYAVAMFQFEKKRKAYARTTVLPKIEASYYQFRRGVPFGVFSSDSASGEFYNHSENLTSHRHGGIDQSTDFLEIHHTRKHAKTSADNSNNKSRTKQTTNILTNSQMSTSTLPNTQKTAAGQTTTDELNSANFVVSSNMVNTENVNNTVVVINAPAKRKGHKKVNIDLGDPHLISYFLPQPAWLAFFSISHVVLLLHVVFQHF